MTTFTLRSWAAKKGVKASKVRAVARAYSDKLKPLEVGKHTFLIKDRLTVIGYIERGLLGKRGR